MPSYDIAAFQPGNPAVQALVTETHGGRLLSGAAKLAQRYTLQLCKEKGSMIYLPNEGCSFLSALRKNAITELDVFAIFSAANLSVTATLQSEESSTDPPDEKFAGANIEKLEITPGNVKISIRVINQANQADLVSLPLSIGS